MKRVITDETVEREHRKGARVVAAPPSTSVITPAAWSRARELGVDFDRADHGAPTTVTKTRPASPSQRRSKHADTGSAKREVDASGVVVVRGGSVVFGAFADAGPGRDVGLVDVVTEADGPMAAGFMSFGRDDGFPWSLDYAEIDYVVEGVLRVELQGTGRVVEARAGDVVSIPRGSKIVFATPSRVKVFYVTYPANWAALASRPQK